MRNLRKDENYREIKHQKSNEKRAKLHQSNEQVESKNEYVKKLRQKRNFREMENEKQIENMKKRRANEEYKINEQKKNLERIQNLRTDPAFVEISKEQKYLNKIKHQETTQDTTLNKRINLIYAKLISSPLSTNENNENYPDTFDLKNNLNFLKALEKFMKNICDGPTQICCCCGVLLFPRQTIKYTKTTLIQRKFYQIGKKSAK